MIKAADESVLSYLDELLGADMAPPQPARPEPPPDPEVVPEPRVGSGAQFDGLDAERLPQAEPESELEPGPEIEPRPDFEAEVKAGLEQGAEAELDDDPELEDEPEPVAAGNLYVVFQLAGVRFAIPADEVERVVGGAEVPCRRGSDQPLKIIDTGSYVLPAGFGATRAVERSQLIVLAGRPIALRCDEAGGVETIAPESIVHRGDRGTRPWLSGMASAHRCALIDIDALIALTGG